VKELDHDFETRYWDFDNLFIGLLQKFHLHKHGTLNKVIGAILALLSFFVSFISQLEVLMVMILALSVYGQDAPAHTLN
jgi:hypothetical protein